MLLIVCGSKKTKFVKNQDAGEDITDMCRTLG